MGTLLATESFPNRTMNYQKAVFLLKKIHSSLLIYNKFCLECSGDLLFYHQIRDSGEKIETLIRYR